jgi:hypothetical protein
MGRSWAVIVAAISMKAREKRIKRMITKIKEKN